jgi:hypothetical protein
VDKNYIEQDPERPPAAAPRTKMLSDKEELARLGEFEHPATRLAVRVTFVFAVKKKTN